MTAHDDGEKERHRSLAAVLAILHRRDGNGAYMYSDEDVARVLPLLVLSSIGDGPVPDDVAPILASFFDAASITPDLDEVAARAHVEDYLARNPPSPALVAELQSLFDERFHVARAARAVKAARSLGAERSMKPVGSDPAPPGAARGGIAARLLATSRDGNKSRAR